jgi:hypothetical protein
LKKAKAQLRTASGRVPIQLSSSGNSLLIFGVPKATHPAVHASVIEGFAGAVGEGKWEGFKGTLEFPGFSPERARASWLRSAYLAFFAALGYRFIFRPELDIVRGRINYPTRQGPATFRLIRRESSPPMLIRIDEPEVFRSYAMFYGPNVVFLPRYNDHGLYTRLAAHPETSVSMSGIEYPWPEGRPTFLHDVAGIAEADAS